MPKTRTNQGRGCLFYGCLTVIALGVVFIGVVSFGIWKFKDVAIRYTDTEPIAFSEVSLSSQEILELRNRFESFLSALRVGKPAVPLKLTASEVNVLMGTYAGLKKYKDWIRLSFEDHKVKGMVSIPTDEISFAPGKGRYLNGSGTFNVSCADGVLIITMDSFEVKGMEAPEMIMSRFKNVNLAKELYEDAEKAEIIKRLKRIEVKDGRIIFEAGPGK